MYYRTDRIIAVRGGANSKIEIRTYTEALSEAEARFKSRQQALSAVHAGEDKEIIGLESVIAVPGVTAPRPPEVRIEGQWQQINI